MTEPSMSWIPAILAALFGASSGVAFTPPVPPPLPGRGEAERVAPSVQGLTTRPVANPNALSGPDAPLRMAPGARVDPDRRPDPKTPGRPTAAGPDPLTILRQPQPLVPVDASVEDRNALDTSLRVISPETWSPTGFRVPYEHPDDANYSVRFDGALMLVYQDGVYTQRGGRTLVGMPPGAWYVIGREDLRPRVRALEPTDSAETNSPAQTGLAPIPTVATGRADGVRLDLRVIPVRPATPPVPPPPVDPPTPPTIEPTATGLRILRDESYRRRFLDRLRERFDPDVPPVRAPAGS
jgi:hypothetical protein